MVSQSITRKNGNIEIKLVHNFVTGFLAKFAAGNENSFTIITIDNLTKQIAFCHTNQEKDYKIDFSSVAEVIRHQYRSVEDNAANIMVALILKTEPKYLALYAYIKPGFGNKLFKEIELNILGRNEVRKVYSYKAAEVEFGV